MSTLVAAITESDFYPFGYDEGDESLPISDDSSAIVELSTEFKFFQTGYKTIYVSLELEGSDMLLCKQISLCTSMNHIVLVLW